ncbi:hypothetical protein OZ668_05165 [Elizabethkingia sp. HX XZB]|uniref:hypothetical protein n=1 Tax=Elizabethkingia sp. HX XZB TaxID=3003193 RepID=UPI002A24B26D|nr:hypothetical protein [Elizabethkingia sp. HX XZB]MDX8567361.1 hypothetical protein [Elizabethkingia sp. HX XZB]
MKQLIRLVLTITVLISCKGDKTTCSPESLRKRDSGFEYRDIVNTPPVSGEKYLISFSHRGFFKTDSSQFDLDRGGYFVFYRINNDLYFANVSGKWHQQSFGIVEQLVHNKSKKVEGNLETSTFKWYYNNTYDSQHGCAIVKLTKTNQSGEPKFSLEMSYAQDEEIYEGSVYYFSLSRAN